MGVKPFEAINNGPRMKLGCNSLFTHPPPPTLSQFECLVYLNNGPILINLVDQKYILGYSTKRALVWFSSSCNKGPIGNLGISLLGDQMVADLMAVGGDFWLPQFQLHSAIKFL